LLRRTGRRNLPSVATQDGKKEPSLRRKVPSVATQDGRKEGRLLSEGTLPPVGKGRFVPPKEPSRRERDGRREEPFGSFGCYAGRFLRLLSRKARVGSCCENLILFSPVGISLSLCVHLTMTWVWPTFPVHKLRELVSGTFITGRLLTLLLLDCVVEYIVPLSQAT
jgi:hypothetical protein